MLMNAFDVLEIPRNSEPKTIRDAYKRLALKYHPDRNPPEFRAENTVKFQEVSEAYENLSNVGRQRGNVNINDIFKTAFSEMFNMNVGNENNNPMNNLAIYRELELTLDDIYNGKTNQLWYERQVPSNPASCICNGTGRYNSDQCYKCGGSGNPEPELIIQSCSIDISIPVGFSETALYYKNSGHMDFNGNVGYLQINIIRVPHKIFKQNGIDLYMEHALSFKESLLGSKLELLFLDNQIREIPINGPVKGGTVIKIKGLGINKVGNLYIKLKIKDFPKSLTSKQRKLIEELF